MQVYRWAWQTGLLAGLCAMLAVPAALAQHRASGDVYLGAAVGYHMAPDAEGQIQKEVDRLYDSGVFSVSMDDGAIGWGLYAGWAVVDGGVIEVGYLDSLDIDVEITRKADNGVLKGNVDTSMWYGAVVGYFPRSQGATVHPFLKVGVARWDYDFGGSLTGGDDGSDPLFGIGIDVPSSAAGLGPVSLRAEYLTVLIDDSGGGVQHRFQAGVNFSL